MNTIQTSTLSTLNGRPVLGPLRGGGRHVPHSRLQMQTYIPDPSPAGTVDGLVCYPLYEDGRMRSGILVGHDDAARDHVLARLCAAARTLHTQLTYVGMHSLPHPSGFEFDAYLTVGPSAPRPARTASSALPAPALDLAIQHLEAVVQRRTEDLRTGPGQRADHISGFHPTVDEPGHLLVVDEPQSVMRQIGADRLRHLIVRGARVGVAILVVSPTLGRTVFVSNELRDTMLASGTVVALGDAPQSAWRMLETDYYLGQFVPRPDRGYLVRRGTHAEFALPTCGFASGPGGLSSDTAAVRGGA